MLLIKSAVSLSEVVLLEESELGCRKLKAAGSSSALSLSAAVCSPRCVLGICVEIKLKLNLNRNHWCDGASNHWERRAF